MRDEQKQTNSLKMSNRFCQEENDGYREILDLLYINTKIDFSNYKHATIRRRLFRRMLVHEINTFAEYVLFLKAVPTELHALREDLLINVTRFFRDAKVFQFLKYKVIPEILRNRKPDKPIRIWVPGCSSGEEVYSLLICFCEVFEEEASMVPIQVFGTDICEIAIEKARYGIYPSSIRKEVSPERLYRFFIKLDDNRYQIRNFMRDMCNFAKLNVNSDLPYSHIDLISCRNLLIYFNKDLQKQVISILHYSLKKSGFLLLGASESIQQSSDFFAVNDQTHKIYVKKQNAVKISHLASFIRNVQRSQFLYNSDF